MDDLANRYEVLEQELGTRIKRIPKTIAGRIPDRDLRSDSFADRNDSHGY